jgi:hypothetical protein
VSEVSRRAVVAASVAGAGVAVLASTSTPAFAGSSAMARSVLAFSSGPDALQAGAAPVRSIYEPAVGQTLRASDGTTSADLRLDAVEDLAGETEPGSEHRFTLLLTPVGLPVQEGVYTLRRPGTPTTTLFLAPIGPHEGTRSLQAVVNRNA